LNKSECYIENEKCNRVLIVLCTIYVYICT